MVWWLWGERRSTRIQNWDTEGCFFICLSPWVLCRKSLAVRDCSFVCNLTWNSTTRSKWGAQLYDSIGSAIHHVRRNCCRSLSYHIPVFLVYSALYLQSCVGRNLCHFSVATFFVKNSLSWRPCPVADPNPGHTHRLDWRYGQFFKFPCQFSIKNQWQ